MFFNIYCLLLCIRVEGKGKAVITDVIYSSKTTEGVQNSGSKEEYEAIQVCLQ